MADFASPFRVSGALMTLLGSGSATGGATLMSMVGDGSVLLFNRSALTDAYLAYGPNSNVIASTVLPVVGAVPPASGGPNLLPLPARSLQTFTFSGPTFVGMLAPGGNALVDVVPGDGE